MSFILNETSGQRQPFVVVRVDFQEAVIVTEHPVEEGVDISDHAQVRPARFVVDAIVPETPTPSQPQTGVPEAIRWLKGALGQPLRLLVDGEGVFRDLFIESAVHPRTVIRERRFTLRLKQVRTVIAAADVVLAVNATNEGAASEVEAGQQATQDTEIESSRLFRAFGAGDQTATGLGQLGAALFGF